MKLYNRPIYHCQTCGAIKRVELTAAVPICCGTYMVKAAMETVSDADATAATVAGKTRADTGHPPASSPKSKAGKLPDSPY